MIFPPVANNSNVWLKGGIFIKRQIMKTTGVISVIFIAVLLTVLTIFFVRPAENPNLKAGKIPPAAGILPAAEIRPLAGHWLKTERDSWYVPALLKTAKPGQTLANPQVLQLGPAKTALNRLADSINIMYIWTDDDELKVISVTSFNKETKQAAIVVVPLHTVVNNGNTVNPGNEYITIRDLYREKGREEIRCFLGQKLDIDIPNLIHVNQAALRKLSDIIGVLHVNGDEITMIEAFEQTAAGLRSDDQDVVRAVASQVFQPRILLAVPQLVWIFTHDIRTDFSAEQLIGIFQTGRQMDLRHMGKTALPGYEYSKGDSTHLFVSEQTWKNIIYEITQRRNVS